MPAAARDGELALEHQPELRAGQQARHGIGSLEACERLLRLHHGVAGLVGGAWPRSRLDRVLDEHELFVRRAGPQWSQL